MLNGIALAADVEPGAAHQHLVATSASRTIDATESAFY
jgi:hypothetical protein